MKWLFAAAAAIVGLAIAALVAVPWLVDSPRVQSLIAASAAQALGRPVKFTSVSVRVFPLPAIELRRLEVAEDPRFGSTPFLTLDRGLLHLRLGPLLARRVEFGDLVLKQPLISLVQNADGRWNFASLGTVRDAASPSRPPSGGHEPRGGGPTALTGLAARVRIEDGVVTYTTRASDPGRHGAGYRLEGVRIALTGEGATMTFEGTARLEPGDLKLTISDGTVALNGARTLADAPLRGRVAIASKDVGRLVAAAAGPTLGMTGALDGSFTLAGTVGVPRASGEVSLPELKVTRTDPRCPLPKQRTLALSRVKAATEWADGALTARPASASMGEATITTTVVATLDGARRVELKDLSVKALPLERVLVDFLCQGYAVTGPLDLTGAYVFRLPDPLVTLGGDGRFAIGRGKVVGAQALVLLEGVAQVAGTLSSALGAGTSGALGSSPADFDSITGTYQIQSGVATSRDLLYTSRIVNVGAAGSYALVSGRLDVDVLVRHRVGEIGAKVTGTTAAPQIRAKASSLREVDPQKVERGLRDLLKRFR